MRNPASCARQWFDSALRLGMLLLLGGSSLSAQNSLYSGPRDYTVGTGPESVVAGDFNGDGRPDIATANQATNDVSVLLQNSSGTFDAAVEYPVGKGPMSLQTGDVNKDGKLDLLLVNVTDNTLAVLLGNGDGTFQAQKLTTISGGPITCQVVGPCLAMGDFNGDDKLDVAVVVPLPQVGMFAVAVLLGKGDGTFQAPVTYAINPQSFTLAAADLNNDGKLDLVVVGYGISLLLGQGDGTFQAAVITPLPQNFIDLVGLVVADFNLDGHLDIATSSNAGNLTLFPGNGNGTFQTPVVGAGASIPFEAMDLNGDGTPDLATGSGGSIGILLNNGDGTFTGGQTLYSSGEGSPVAQAIALSDLNNDQKPDLVIAQSNTHPFSVVQPDIVSVVDGNGDGSFATFPAYAGIRGQVPGGFGYATFGTLAAADFNGDGKIDLDVGLEFFEKATLQDGTGAGLYLNNGAGFLAPATTQLNVFSYDSPYAVAGDLNGDGRVDLVVGTNGGGGAVAILLGKGDGTFQPEMDYGTGVFGPIAIGDFNNDGKPDVIGISSAQLSVLIGNGDGTFGFPVNSPIGGQFNVTGLAVADFDHDGKLDVAALIRTSDSLVLGIFMGNGDGTFTPGPNYDAGLGPAAIATGDLNGDGIPDLVVGNADQNSSVVVRLGVGDGTFQSPITTVTGNQISAVAVSDLNLDGKADVVITNAGWHDVSVLLGKGDGTLQGPMQFYLDNFGSGAVTVADFNGDGKPDLAMAGFNSVTLLLSGNGLGGPAGLLSPATLGFGSQTVGSPSAAYNAVLSNSGSKTLTISSIAIAGPQSGDYQQTNFCGASLPPGADCLIKVVFSPQAAGTRTAVVQVTDNAANSPQTINLSGAGGLFTVTVAPASLAFANQLPGSTSASQAVTLTNTGNELLVINSIGITGTNAGDFLQTNNCGSPFGGYPLALAVGDSCPINVSFAPTAGGSRAATLTFTNNAANSPQTVALSGTAQDFAVTVATPSQSVSPGQTATYNLTVTPGGGFNQMVDMSCTGAPAHTTCSVAPSSFTLDGSASQAVTVSVATTASSAGLTQPSLGTPLGRGYGSNPAWLGIPGMVGLVSLLGWRRERRRWLWGLTSVCLLAVGITFSACGGGSSSGGGGGGGVQAGTYNLTVTGKFTSGSTTLTRTTPLTLVVH